MSKPFFIGIDGGATSCRARIRDMDGSLLGEGESGPANIHSNFRLAMQSIRLACEAALRSAALDEKTLQHSHAGLGLAGAGIKSACDRLLSEKMPFASMVLGPMPMLRGWEPIKVAMAQSSFWAPVPVV